MTESFAAADSHRPEVRAARPTGSITVAVGPMFAGKSSFLQMRVRRALIAGHGVQVFRPVTADRPGYDEQGFITSHDGLQVRAQCVAAADDIASSVLPGTRLVAIDEAQFFGASLLGVAQALADEGRVVVVAGLDQDYRARPFGPIPQLLAIAEHVVKLDAVCMRCGEAATRTQRLADGQPASGDGPTVLVGAGERYEARCRSCHRPPPSASEEPAPLVAAQPLNASPAVPADWAGA